MKRRVVTITAAILLILTLLSGCYTETNTDLTSASPDTSEQVSATPVDGVPTLSDTPSESPSESDTPPLDFSCDETACRPWQLAYLALLRDICQSDAKIISARDKDRGSEYWDELISEHYCLYDVDKDGIPEIFIRFGESEAEYRTKVYTCQNGSAVYAGEFISGHSALYTWPEDNAVLFYVAHMGYAEIYKISIKDGKINKTEIFTEAINGEDRDYTAPGSIVPGSVRLDDYRTMLTLPELTPLTLPIYAYYPETRPITDKSAGDSRKAITEVLAGTRHLYGVSGDGFNGDTGWMTFHDYCQPETVYEYARKHMKTQKSGWADFNQEGREECILYLVEDTEDAYKNDVYVILSEQDGTVYAYCLSYFDGEVFRDGVFSDDYGWSFGLSFYKNQCYEYEKAHDITIPPVEWEPHSFAD
jgi:hypothetical protein